MCTLDGRDLGKALRFDSPRREIDRRWIPACPERRDEMVRSDKSIAQRDIQPLAADR